MAIGYEAVLFTKHR